MTGPPRVARALLRALLPEHEIRDALEGDLAEAFAERATRSPRSARWWYRREVLRLPYLALNREIRRLAAREGTRTGGGRMGGWTMDFRIAVRSLWKRPAFSGVAVLTLATSVGAATLLFSVVAGVLLAPLPYQRPEELVSVYLTSDGWRDGPNELLRAAWDSHTLTLDHAEAFRDAPGPLTDLSAFTYRRLPLRVDGNEDRSADAIMVDAHLFRVLGVQPALGRLPTAGELNASERVAVLRNDTWRTWFGGDPDVVGRTFRLGDDVYTVVGVMPPDFFFPTEDGGDLLIPIREEARSWPSYYGVARLAHGASVADATAFLNRVARRMGEDDAGRAGFGARAMPHLDNVVGRVRGGIRLLFGTTLVVVLVACVNLANLFLARASSRREELAVRSSLGAGTGSLVVVMLSEAIVIGVVGGGLGVVLAAGALDPFVVALGTSLRGLPRQGTIGLDGRVLLFSLAATLTSTMVASLGPTLSSARRAPALALDRRGSGSSVATRRSQRLLLAAQAALTVVLVCAAGLLGRSFLAAVSVDMGMDTDRVAVLEVGSDERYAGPDAAATALGAMRERVASLPGVRAVSATSSLPSTGGVLLLGIRPDGASADQTALVPSVSATEGYFETLGIPVLAGRGLRSDDGTLGAERVVVSESLAVQLFGGTNVVGRHVLQESEGDPTPMKIVGVVGEARQLSPFQEPSPTLYYTIPPGRARDVYVTLAVEGDPAGVLEIAREALTSASPSVEVVQASTLRRMLLDGMRHIWLRAVLMTALAFLAAVLAVIGIYGVVAHFTAEQRREVGIRMALGARAGREVGRVVRHALTPTVLGVGLGVAIAVASSRVMKGVVFGIEPTDPVTYVAVAVVMLLTTWVAAWVPARRTASVDPVRVLKGE